MSERAADVWMADLEPSAGGPLGVRAGIGLVVRAAAAAVGVLDDLAAGRVVVRRIEDNEPVLELPVSGSEEAAGLLDRLTTQLDELDPDAFADEWGIERDH